MTEKDIIKLCIQHNLFNLLNKQACQMIINELLQNKELTIYEGNFYLNNNVINEFDLDTFVKSFDELFSFKRLGVKKNGDKKALRIKAKKFQLETGISYQEMMNLGKYHIEDTPPKYVVSSKYFFYKGRGVNQTSKAKEILEILTQEKDEEEMFNLNMDN